MRTAQWSLVGLWLGVAAGCTTDLSVPADARLTCSKDSPACPDGWTCKPAIGRCVRNEGVSADPVTASATLEPTLLRLGQETVVTVTVAGQLLSAGSEDALKPIVLRLRPSVGGAAREDDPRLEPESRDGAVYTFRYKASRLDPEREVGVDAELIDSTGTGSTVKLGTLTFDFTSPTFSGDAINGHDYPLGSTVQVRFIASEPLPAAPKVALESGQEFKEAAESKPPAYVFELPVTPDLPQDAAGVGITVSLADPAGNPFQDVLRDGSATAREQASPRRPVFDFVVPTVKAGSVSLDETVLRQGREVAIVFDTSEELAPPVVRLVDGTDAVTATPSSQARGSHFKYTYVARQADSGRTRALRIALADAAGNAGSYVGTEAVTFDFDAPALAKDQAGAPIVLLSGKPLRSPATAGTAVGTIDFAVTELLDPAKGELKVVIGNNLGEATCPATTDVAAPFHFKCTFEAAPNLQPGDPLEGTRPVTLLMKDKAGNDASAALGFLTFDFTPPVLKLASYPVNRPAHLGEPLSLTLTSTEELSDALDAQGNALWPKLTSTATLPAFTRAVAGNTYTYSYTVGATDQGSFSVGAEAEDLAGNKATVATPVAFAMDGKAPLLDKASVVLAPDRVAGGGTFTLSFNVDDKADVDETLVNGKARFPLVTAHNGKDAPFDLTRVLPGPNDPPPTKDYVFQGTAPATGNAPFWGLTVQLGDVAGNVSSETPGTVQIDNVPPVLKSTKVAPSSAKFGDEIQVLITANETLKLPPATLTATGKTTGKKLTLALEAGAVADGISYTYLATVDASVANDVYGFDGFTLTDTAGNAAPVTPDSAVTVEVDATIPTVGKPAVTPRASFSAVAGFNQLTLTFTCEDVGAGLKVMLGNKDLAPSCTWASGSYTCTHTVISAATATEAADVEGTNLVQIEARDRAGNVGTATTTVSFDFTAPSLVSSAVTPAQARAGETVLFTLNTSEPLATPAPALDVRRSAATASELTFTAVPGTTYAYAFSVPVTGGASMTGKYGVRVKLVDALGNESAELVADKQVDLDLSVPQLAVTRVGPALRSAQSGFNTVDVDFSVTDSAISSLKVLLDTRDLAPVATVCTLPASNVGTATCRYTITDAASGGADSEGVHELRIEARDPVGNVATSVTPLTFDFTPPSPVGKSVSPQKAKAGDTVLYTLSASEELAASPAPALTVKRAGASANELDFALVSNTRYAFSYLVPPNAASSMTGVYDVSFTLTDTVGNAKGYATGNGSVDLDVSPPQLTVTQVSPTRLSAQAGYDTLSVAFSVSDAAVGSLKVLLDQRDLTALPNVCTLPANNLGAATCTYAVTDAAKGGVDTEGAHELRIEARDPVGNVSSSVTALTFDFTAPTTLSSTVSPARAKAGDTVLYTVTASEELKSAPTLVVKRPSATGSELAFAAVAGTTYAYSYLVPLNAASSLTGAYDVTFELTDALGNKSATQTGQDKVELDVSPPQLSALTVPRTHLSAVTGFNHLTASFSVSDAAVSELKVWLDSKDLTAVAGVCTVPAGNVGAVSCDYPVTSADAEGTHELRVEARDPAGNLTAKSAVVSFDFTAPKILSSAVNVNPVKAGDTLTYRLTVDEPLSTATPPALRAFRTGGTETFDFGLVGGTTYLFSYAPNADAAGDWTVKATLTDEVGNTATALTKDKTGADLAGFYLDVVKPTIANVAVSNSKGPSTRFSLIAGYEVVGLTFETNEAIPSNLMLVKISGVDVGASCAATPITGGVRYGCSYPLPAGANRDPEGTRPISIDVADKAGNSASASLSIAFDYTAPGINSASVTPSGTAKIGDAVLYTLTPNEALAGVPGSPTFKTSAGATLPFTLFQSAGGQYVYRYTVTRGVTDGTYAASFLLTDDVGNGAAVTSTTTVSVDGNEPVITISAPGQSPLVKKSAVSPYDSLAVVFTVSENVGTGYAVRLGKTTLPAAECTVTRASTPTDPSQDVTCTHAVTAADGAGVNDIVVSAVDPAGNPGSARTAVILDFTGPKVVGAQVNFAKAKLGDALVYTLLTDETVKVDASTPTFSFKAGSATLASVTAAAAPGGVTFQHTVAAADANGTYAGTFTLLDEVGNPATNVTTDATGAALPTFNIDATQPRVEGLTVGATNRFSAKSGHNTFTLAFTLSEPIDAAGLKVLMNGTGSGHLPMQFTTACATLSTNAPYAYTCGYTVSPTAHPASTTAAADTEGFHDIRVEAADGNGNLGTASTGVEFDFTAPKLVAASATPKIAGRGAQLFYSVTASEQLSAAPASHLYPKGGSTELASGFTAVPGSTYTFNRTVQSSDTTGEYEVRFDLADAVGNTAPAVATYYDATLSASPIPLPTFSIDVDLPVVTLGAKPTSKVSKQPGYSTLSATFTTSDTGPTTDPLTVTVKVFNQDITDRCPKNATTGVYTCAFDAATDARAPSFSTVADFLVEARDASGNSSFVRYPVVFDYTAPSATTDAFPLTPKLNDVLVYKVFPDEALKTSPGLTIRHETSTTATLAMTLQPNTTYNFEKKIDTTDVEGLYGFEIVLTDEVGNTTTLYAPSPLVYPSGPPPAGKTRTVYVDSSAPVITVNSMKGARPASSTFTSPAQVRAGGKLRIDFDATERLYDLKVYIDSLASSFSPCTETQRTSSWNYVCDFTVPNGFIAAGTEATKVVQVEATDQRGNPARATQNAVIDFKPPGVLFATVNYYPGAGNPLPNPSAATTGTTVGVTIIPDEAIDVAATTALHIAPEPAFTYGFAVTSEASDRVELSMLVDTEGEGAFDLGMEWTDLAGNTAGTASPVVPLASLGAKKLVVLKTPPVASINLANLRFLRSPWGNSGDEPVSTVYPFPAGPRFELAPANPLSTSTMLGSGTFLIRTSPTTFAPPSMVRVYSAASLGSVMGVLAPSSGGDAPRTLLNAVDTATVYLTVVDAAGNESTPRTKVTNAEWVATLNQVNGGNPHALSAVPQVSPLLTPPLESAVGLDARDASGTSGTKGASVVRLAAAPTWAKRSTNNTSTAVAPGTRTLHGLAYDVARGRTVMFGGAASDQHTFEWDGSQWLDKTPFGRSPTGNREALMVYDAARRRVLLHGGIDSGGGQLSETWTWDGTSWTAVANSGPKLGAMCGAFDARRGKVVLFGGATPSGLLGDTWEWDGAAWTQVTPTVSPPARRSCMATYDAKRGRVVVFGGTTASGVTSELWEYDGATWTNRTPATSPAPREQGALAWDPVRQRAMLFGGQNGGMTYSDMWEWDGSAWTDRTAVYSGVYVPSRGGHAMVWDTLRERLVMFGGSHSGILGDTWEFDSTKAMNRTPSGMRPEAYTRASIAYDSDRHVSYVFGGSSEYDTPPDGRGDRRQVWEWTGESWKDLTPSPSATQPAARVFASASYDPVLKRMLVFSGGKRDQSSGNIIETYSDLWSMDPTTLDGNLRWTNRTPGSGLPQARIRSPWAYDSARKVHVMFGGNFFGTRTNDTWEYDSAANTFASKSPTNVPQARDGHGLAYQPTRGVTVMFGGATYINFAVQQLEDVWVWNGTDWLPAMGVPGTGPGPREGMAMAYDSDRDRIVVIGGVQGNGNYKQDVWELDVTFDAGTGKWSSSWLDRTPFTAGPSMTQDQVAAYDAYRKRMVMFGGKVKEDNDVWELTHDKSNRLALQLDANLSNALVPQSSVTQVTVRAFCGANYSPFPSSTGCELWGWSYDATLTGDVHIPGWVQLPGGANTVGVNTTIPYLGLPTGTQALATLTGSAASTMVMRDQLSVQVRPAGPAGVGPASGAAQVALDYAEIRVQYTAP